MITGFLLDSAEKIGVDSRNDSAGMTAVADDKADSLMKSRLDGIA